MQNKMALKFCINDENLNKFYTNADSFIFPISAQ